MCFVLARRRFDIIIITKVRKWQKCFFPILLFSIYLLFLFRMLFWISFSFSNWFSVSFWLSVYKACGFRINQFCYAFVYPHTSAKGNRNPYYNDKNLLFPMLQGLGGNHHMSKVWNLTYSYSAWQTLGQTSVW